MPGNSESYPLDDSGLRRGCLVRSKERQCRQEAWAQRLAGTLTISAVWAANQGNAIFLLHNEIIIFQVSSTVVGT